MALYNQDTTTQYLFFLKNQDEEHTYSMKRRPQRDCEQRIVLVSLFLNGATKRPEMAAPNTALFCESFHATQTRVQLVYFTVHT